MSTGTSEATPPLPPEIGAVHRRKIGAGGASDKENWKGGENGSSCKLPTCKTLLLGNPKKVSNKDEEVIQQEKVLVTGGDGYLGVGVVELFRQNGYFCASYDISKGMDICDEQQLTTCFNKLQPNVVVHLAAVSDLNLYNDGSDDVNVAATKVIADLCLKHGARMIFASTCCLYGNNGLEVSNEESILSPTEDYAKGKGMAEDYILALLRENATAPLYIARLATFFGSSRARESLFISIAIRAALSGGKEQVTIHGSGHQRRTYTHVNDIASGLFLLSTASTQELAHTTYNLSIQERTSVIEVIRVVTLLSGKPVSVIWGEDRDCNFDQAEIRSDRLRSLGWVAKYTFAEGMREAIESYTG